MHLQEFFYVSLSHFSWITFYISSNEWIQCLWALVFILIICHIFSIGFKSDDWADHRMCKRQNFWHHFVVILRVWYRVSLSIHIISFLSSKQHLKDGSSSFFKIGLIYILEFIFLSFCKEQTGPFKPRVMAPQMPIKDLSLLNVGLKY